MINRQYGVNGEYGINLTGGRKKRVKKMKGGNCGCSSCLSGSGFFEDALDWISNTGADIVSNVPIVGRPIGTLWRHGNDLGELLSPSYHRPQPNRPVVLPPHKYVNLPKQQQTQQYGRAQDLLNNPRGRGKITDFVKKHKGKIIPTIATGLKLGALGLKAYDMYKGKSRTPIYDSGAREAMNYYRNPAIYADDYEGNGKPKKVRKMKGKGKITDFLSKHKGKILKGALALGATALLGAHGHNINRQPHQSPLFSGIGFD